MDRHIEFHFLMPTSAGHVGKLGYCKKKKKKKKLEVDAGG